MPQEGRDSILLNQEDVTPWQKFVRHINEFSDEAVMRDSVAMKAFATAFLPKGVDAEASYGRLLQTALNAIRKPFRSKRDKQKLEEFTQKIRLEHGRDPTPLELSQLHFDLAVGRVRGVTYENFSLVDVSDTAHAFIMGAVVQGALVDGFLTDLVRAGTPALSDSAALGANAIMSQVKGVRRKDPDTGVPIAVVTPGMSARQVAANAGFNPHEAFAAINQWGLTYDQRMTNTILEG